MRKGARAERRITAFDTNAQEPVQEILVDGRVLVEPMEVMKERATMWFKYWCPCRAPVHPREEWLPMVKRAAVDAKEETGGLRCSSAAAAIRRAPAQVGVGAN